MHGIQLKSMLICEIECIFIFSRAKSIRNSVIISKFQNKQEKIYSEGE